MTLHEKISAADSVETHVVNGISTNKDLSKGPFVIDGCDTLVKLFAKRCSEITDKTAHREKDFGIWLSYSWKEFWDNTKHIALGLRSLGLQRGDVISILSEDNQEWIYADIATQCMGGIASGVYTTDSAEQLKYLVNDSNSKFLFVENDEQLDKFLEVRAGMPGLVNVIVLDRDGLHDFRDDKVIFLDELYALGRAYEKEHPDVFEAEIAKSTPGDTAILVYTSGTTGPPKGAMISHSNIMFSLASGLTSVPTFDTDDLVCFLPLCHILERLFSGFAPIVSRATINFAESPETVFENVQEVSPQTFVAVPRVWEKIYSRVMILAGDATPVQRWAFN
jgi:long-chain acyl-CoA synthetase